MLTADLITEDIPPLKSSDTVNLALQWMEEFKVNHLPVIEGKEFVGIVSENDLMDSNKPDSEIGKANVPMLKTEIHGNQHAFDALKVMTDLHLSLLPVLDEHNHYLGSVTQRSVLEKISGISAVIEPGGIIELEMHKNDYTLTQIAGIIESNDAKVLNLMVESLPDPNRILVTVKVNREDLSRIMQTFYRYNYNVRATYHQSSHDSDLHSRFNEFMRFLNI